MLYKDFSKALLGCNDLVFKTSDWRKLAQVANLLPIVETSDAIGQETKEKLYKELFEVRNKRPALMRRIIKRNIGKHDDLTKHDYEIGIKQALYLREKPIFQDVKNKNYWHFVGEPIAKGRSYYDLILENIKTKKRLEIVHIHKRQAKSMEKMLRKYGILK